MIHNLRMNSGETELNNPINDSTINVLYFTKFLSISYTKNCLHIFLKMRLSKQWFGFNANDWEITASAYEYEVVLYGSISLPEVEKRERELRIKTSEMVRPSFSSSFCH